MTEIVSFLAAKFHHGITFSRVQRLIASTVVGTIVLMNLVLQYAVFVVLSYYMNDYYAARWEGVANGWVWILFHPVKYAMMWIYSIPFGPANGVYGIPTWFTIGLWMSFTARRLLAVYEYHAAAATYHALVSWAWRMRVLVVGWAGNVALFPWLLANRIGLHWFFARLWMQRAAHRTWLFVRYDLKHITVPTGVVLIGTSALAPIVYLGHGALIAAVWVALPLASTVLEFTDRRRRFEARIAELLAAPD